MKRIKKWASRSLTIVFLSSAGWVLVGGGESLRLAPNVGSRSPGLMTDKASEFGQLPGNPDPQEVPLIRKERTNTLSVNPCPPSFSHAAASEDPTLHALNDQQTEGCRTAETPSLSRDQAGQIGKDAPSETEIKIPKEAKKIPRKTPKPSPQEAHEGSLMH